MEQMQLGLAADFERFPAELTLKGKPYYLLKNGEGFRLVSRFCPHAGAIVDSEDGELFCYMHGWSFDVSSGACLNVPGAELMAFAVEEREGRLYASV